MAKHETNIDTVGIQLDLSSPEQQRNKMDLIWNWIISRNLGKLEKDPDNKSRRIARYRLMSSGTKIAVIHTGFTRARDKLTRKFIKVYYVRIVFAGLKSFKVKRDEASNNALLEICAFLNTSRTPFRMVELDVAIDLFCSFYNVLGICINPVNGVPYNPIGTIQYFDGSYPTSYIHNYSNLQSRNDAFMRFYIYNKTAKESLPFTVTRAELKLQNRFFLRYGFSVESIMRALSNFGVLYFNSSVEKQNFINRYSGAIKPYGYDVYLNQNYRLYPNSLVIEEFIRQIQTVYVDFYGNVTLPLQYPLPTRF